MANYSQWHTERPLVKKFMWLKRLMFWVERWMNLWKLFSTKSAPIDPNDMPLSTLIENNNLSMDMNFVGRNNFGNNAYRGNFNIRRFLVIPLITMVIPTTTLMEILIRCPLIWD